MEIFNKFVIIGFCIFIAYFNEISSQELHSGAPCSLLDGSPGVCKSAETCKWLEDQISTKRITNIREDLLKLRCSFEENKEIVCCGDPEGPILRGTQRKSKEACDLYRKIRQPPITFLIINGNISALGEFPHMAALGYYTGPNNEIDFKCGGSLISERYILTAGHCAVDNRVQPSFARLGTINIINPDFDPLNNGEKQDVDIDSVVLHPEYRSIRNYHDIALIRLVSVVQFTRNLHPACLHSELSDILPSTDLIISGWGKVDVESEARSPFLLKTNLTIVNLNECNRSLAVYFNRKLPTGINSGQLCAHDPNGKSDACQGDSGGPIQILDDDRSMPIIIGVTSFGIDCGTKLPSIYTRVAFYLDWIESVVWPN